MSARRASLLSCIVVVSLSGSGCGPFPGDAPSETEPSPGSSSPEVGAGSRPPPAPHGEGHRKMLALLRDIAARTDDEHVYLGDGYARQLREAVKKLPPNVDPRRRWDAERKLGTAELRLGNVEAAIEHLQRAYNLLPQAKLGVRWATTTRFELGVAYLRLGEVENCCKRNTPESCVLPIKGGGRHSRVEGSAEAIRYFIEALREAPTQARLQQTVRWLLNIAHMTLGSYPDKVPPELLIPPQSFRSRREFPRLVNVAARLGLNTVNLSGAAVTEDFDGDGDLDILTSTWDTRGPMRYFENLGDGSFGDFTSDGGLDGLLGGFNLKQADYDNDGDKDVLVLRGGWLGEKGRHPNSLLRNDGHGHFTDVAHDVGLAEAHYPTQTADWADYDLDGDVDIFIGNETTDAVRAPCQLFRNNGDGTFTDVAAAAGVENLRFTKGVVWGDYDNDRDPDLYLSNLDGENRLYRNNGDGTFTDVARETGVMEPTVSFPVWFWDFDNDGALDIYVSSYAGRTSAVGAYYLGEPVSEGLPKLYRGDGKGGFVDVSRQQGLTHPVLPMGSNYGDLDGDGFVDFYLGTGDPDYSTLVPNLMFLNRGGSGFDDVTFAGGFGQLQKGHSVSFADLDNDGDLDIFEQMGGAYRGDAYGDALYENPGFGNRWIRVQLVGRESNRSAIGARLSVHVREGDRTRVIRRRVTSGGSFGSNPLRRTIGLGKADAVELLEVFWPRTAKTQICRDISLDQTIRVVEGEARFTRIEQRSFRLGG